MCAVLDASVFIRALADRRPDARNWLDRLDRGELDVAVPSLVFAEIAQALAGYVRAERLGHPGAAARLDFVRGLPLEIHQLELLVPLALGVALQRSISVYDSCYVVLAEAEDAVLVTADRRLARAYDRVELVA